MFKNVDGELVVEGAERTEDLTRDIRTNATPDVHKPFVKPTIKLEDTLSADQIMAVSKLVQEQTKAAIEAASFDSNKNAQSVRKSVTPITDFSKLTMDAVYDLSMPIEAKAFMSADVMHVRLKDTNYEARWVNKNSMRLGDMLARGFTYVVAEDLLPNEGIQTGKDAEGHYSYNDVVAMKIDKATYYGWMRQNHLKTLATTNSASLAKQAANTAGEYMQKESGYSNDFGNAQATKKMEFYDAGISV